jgi:glycine/D-amino acid oxidase-like deaminating enzyme
VAGSADRLAREHDAPRDHAAGDDATDRLARGNDAQDILVVGEGAADRLARGNDAPGDHEAGEGTDRLARGNDAPGDHAAGEGVTARLARGNDAPEVLVVGGGVTGCSCALTLATAGVRVRLLEVREIAGGASGRNGGFALRGAALPYHVARAALGHERASTLWRLTEDALVQIERLAGDAFRQVGSLRLAAGARERDALADELDALREDGFAAEWADSLPAPLDRLYVAAVLNPGDAATSPARWVRRLARRAAAAGAEIRERSAFGGRRGAASTTVIAVDGLSAGLVPELGDLVRPVRGQVLVTEPVGAGLFSRPHYAREGFDYWQQLPDGRLLVGGRRDTSLVTEYTDVEETTAPVQAELEALVHDLLGRVPRITHRWAGIWGETPDRLPLAGRVPGAGDLWVAGGYSGHGNVLGFVCGDLVARAILGDEPAELGLFDPARFSVPA